MRRFILFGVLCIVSCTQYIQTIDCNSSHDEVVITNYGAVPDGNTDCGSIINKLIDGFLQLSTREIVLTSPDVMKPVHVRYCFKNFPFGNVTNLRGLPLLPFRTDKY